MSINFHVGVGWTEEEFSEVSGRNQAFDLRAAPGARQELDVQRQDDRRSHHGTGYASASPRSTSCPSRAASAASRSSLEAPRLAVAELRRRHRITGGLLPSEYFRRQIYGTFWFEEASARHVPQLRRQHHVRDRLPAPDEPLPGPGSDSPSPREIVDRARRVLDPITFEKVMYGNAARVYRLS